VSIGENERVGVGVVIRADPGEDSQQNTVRSGVGVLTEAGARTGKIRQSSSAISLLEQRK
jgi:hypothetical protein